MLRCHFFLGRKRSLSLDEFFSYWRERHAYAGERNPLTKRYVQSHRIAEVQADDFFDGVAEVWWENEEAAQESLRISASKFITDEANFVDPGRREFLATTEHEILKPQGKDLIKGVFMIRRHPGLTVAEFRKYWFEVHSPQVLKVPGMRGYVVCPTIDAAYTWAEPRWDGVSHVYWDNLESMAKAFASEEAKPVGEKAISAGSKFFFAREHLIY
jgi:uncharacterized protein (TIGR02118 family)